MYIFRSIHEIINTIAAAGTAYGNVREAKDAQFPLFRRTALLKDDENRLKLLIEKEVIRQNGNFVELDARFLDFFELLLEANEEINTAIIDENIAFLHELMDYYEKEQIASRKESYVRNIKITFQKIARTTIRNIMNLQSSIDNAFKHEPTYQIKIAKLENLDKKRIHIQQLIDTTENLILHEERRFFQQATDEELNRILLELRSELQLGPQPHPGPAGHHQLPEPNQEPVILVEKIRKVKYLQDQFELRSRSNLSECSTRNIPCCWRAPCRLRSAVTALSEYRRGTPRHPEGAAQPAIPRDYPQPRGGAFSEEDLESPAMYQEVIDLEETGDYIQAQAQARWNDASAPEEDLFHYLMHYTFARETSRNAPLVLPDECRSTKPSPHQRGVRPVPP